LITAAAHALAAGDPLSALNRVALRDDPPALALRGIAMAQLGDLPRAKSLIQRAAKAFGKTEPVARARCIVAEAEIAFAMRELGHPPKRLQTARATLEACGDRINTAHARHLEARRLLLLGRLDEAERLLSESNTSLLPPASRAISELVNAGIAMRRLKARAAHAALAQAQSAALEAGIPALLAEVDSTGTVLDAPAARLVTYSEQRPVALGEIEKLIDAGTLVVDACRNGIRCADTAISLAGRPMLFTLACELARAWPGDVTRNKLIERVFRIRQADESHRARLRVEMGRLRKLLRPIAAIAATRHGFALDPLQANDVAVLEWPLEKRHAAVLALLADGESWSSSALALVLGTSQRTVQRALDALAEAGKVQSYGRGRARRWITAPVPGFATTLLLPVSVPGA
jgi:hypothetical protein